MRAASRTRVHACQQPHREMESRQGRDADMDPSHGAPFQPEHDAAGETWLDAAAGMCREACMATRRVAMTSTNSSTALTNEESWHEIEDSSSAERSALGWR